MDIEILNLFLPTALSKRVEIFLKVILPHWSKFKPEIKLYSKISINI